MNSIMAITPQMVKQKHQLQKPTLQQASLKEQEVSFGKSKEGTVGSKNRSNFFLTALGIMGGCCVMVPLAILGGLFFGGKKLMGKIFSKILGN